MFEEELRVSTVDPIEAALGGQQADPDAPEAVESDAPSFDHPALAKYGGDAQKALDAFQELQSTYGRDGHRLGEENAQLRQQLEQLQQPTQPAEPEQYGEVPDIGVDQLEQWMDEDRVQATAYLVAQGNQVLAQQFKEMLDKRLGPVEQTTHGVAKGHLAESLGKAIGSEKVIRNADAINAITSAKGFYDQPTDVQFNVLKTVVLAAEYERDTPRGASQDGGAATPKGVAVEGGSGGRTPQSNEQPSEIEAFLQAMDTPPEPAKGVFGRPQRR